MPDGTSEIFFAYGLDRNSRTLPVGQIICTQMKGERALRRIMAARVAIPRRPPFFEPRYSCCASQLFAASTVTMAPVHAKMGHSIHDKTLDAKKARILINALIDCAKAGVRSSFSIKEMICGVSLYLEFGKFNRENWRTYHRLSDAAKQIRDAGDKDWKRHVTFEHARPINVMYRMLLDERATLTVERAAIIIGEYPPVLITVAEEMRMAKLGFMHGGVPEERYAHIPISGFNLRSEVAAAKLVRTHGG